MKVLIKYVRKESKDFVEEPDGTLRKCRGKPVGVVAAVGKGRIGWSLCGKNDAWDKEVGRSMAIGRALAGDNNAVNLLNLPQTVSKDYFEMFERSQVYFARKRNGG